MTHTLNARAALVTGASRGIGASIARTFARAGAAVALASRDQVSLERVAADIREHGGTALVVPTDVTDAAAIRHLVDTVLEAFGRLDVACNNAAAAGHPLTPLADVAVEAFDAGVAVSLRGVFLAMKYEIPAMLATGGGAIVNVSSTAGLEAVGGLTAYVTAKHGLQGLTKVAALDYAGRGVRVNAVAPGPILTDNLIRAGEAAQQAAASAMPMQRVGMPDEVAATVLWLCSDQASYVTGTTVVIDGGKMAGTPPFQVQLRPSA